VLNEFTGQVCSVRHLGPCVHLERPKAQHSSNMVLPPIQNRFKIRYQLDRPVDDARSSVKDVRQSSQYMHKPVLREAGGGRFAEMWRQQEKEDNDKVILLQNHL
jgi:hypothetical protein